MAKRKRTRRKSSRDEYPGWVWMLFGLAVGLSVAFAIYRKYSGTPAPAAVAQQPASLPRSVEDSPARAQPEPQETEESRFTFYDMLPKFEVVIPEEEPEVARDSGRTAIELPGVYVLQAGSFTEHADADRRRAELALLGVESRVQRVTIDDRTFHRVRIGPTDDLAELNRIRARLGEADIDVLRIRLGD